MLNVSSENLKIPDLALLFGLILTIFANACSGPNILGQILEILSEHIARNFGNFHLASSPIIGGPPKCPLFDIIYVPV